MAVAINYAQEFSEASWHLHHAVNSADLARHATGDRPFSPDIWKHLCKHFQVCPIDIFDSGHTVTSIVAGKIEVAHDGERVAENWHKLAHRAALDVYNAVHWATRDRQNADGQEYWPATDEDIASRWDAVREELSGVAEFDSKMIVAQLARECALVVKALSAENTDNEYTQPIPEDIPALDKNEARVLVHLAKHSPVLRTLDDIADPHGADVSRATATTCVQRLCDLQLADRPNGDRKGATATTRGIAVANKIERNLDSI